jgi:hypothetical protein
MRAKGTVAALLLAIALCGAGIAPAAAQELSGRFQVVVLRDTVLMMDTATGATWRLAPSGNSWTQLQFDGRDVPAAIVAPPTFAPPSAPPRPLSRQRLTAAGE